MRLRIRDECVCLRKHSHSLYSLEMSAMQCVCRMSNGYEREQKTNAYCKKNPFKRCSSAEEVLKVFRVLKVLDVLEGC